MEAEKLRIARTHLNDAIKILDEAQSTWSECVTALHMAELKVKMAQRRMKQCYNVVEEVLNGEG